MKIALSVLAVVPLLAGCPLQPDVVYDSGIVPDSGTTDSDAGTDGGLGSGTISASLATTSSPSYVPVIWNGSDLAFSQQDLAAGTATLRGDSLAAGHLVLQLTGLVVGQAVGVPILLSYSTANSAEAWSCSIGTSNLCSAVVAVSSYDGVTIAGSFSAQFNVATIGTDAAALSGGVYSVSFSH